MAQPLISPAHPGPPRSLGTFVTHRKNILFSKYAKTRIFYWHVSFSCLDNFAKSILWADTNN